MRRDGKQLTGHLFSFPSASADADACDVESLSKIACCEWHSLARNVNVRRMCAVLQYQLQHAARTMAVHAAGCCDTPRCP
jgi:hypothetical protein